MKEKWQKAWKAVGTLGKRSPSGRRDTIGVVTHVRTHTGQGHPHGPSASPSAEEQQEQPLALI